MVLECRAVPGFYKNGYLLGCDQSREAVLVDPGAEIEDLLEVVRARHLHVTSILLTHGHVDHVEGVAKAKAALDALVHIHEEDMFLYRAAVQQAQNFGLDLDPLPRIDRFYDLRQPIPFGTYEVRVHHTPGHSPGAVCLEVGPAGQPGKKLFVGDTLFAGSIGRTDLPGGNYETLIRSIRNVLFAFGDDAEVYPGHGPATTIGQERRANPFLQV